MTLPKATLVAMIAGLATAVLSAQMTPGVLLFGFLAALAPLPLLIVGFGWHPLVAALGGIFAALIVKLAASPFGAIQVAALYALPTWGITAYAARLFLGYARRPDRDGVDLGRIAIGYILYFALAFVLSAIVIEPDFAVVMQRIRAVFEQVLTLLKNDLASSPPVDPHVFPALVDAATAIVMPVGAILNFIAMTIAGTLGMQIAERMGRLPYPRPDFRRFRLPGGTLILLGMALIVASQSAYLGLFGEMVAGMLAIAYLLQGLAVVHVRTLGLPMRTPLLALIWITLVFFGFSAAIFIVVGLLDHLLDFRRGRL